MSSAGHGHHNRHHHHHHIPKFDPNFDPWLHFHISMNEDGSLDRFNQMPSVSATGDREANSESCPVLSKDVVLDAEKKTSLRIYRPNNYYLLLQYEDAVDGINWAKDQALKQDAGDPWLRDYGDFSRCYLYGKSSGGNIALNAAKRIADMNLAPISIVGMILNQPLFGGHRRTKSELKPATDPVLPLPCTDLAWELALPGGRGSRS